MKHDFVLLGIDFINDPGRSCTKTMGAEEEQLLYQEIQNHVRSTWDGVQAHVGPFHLQGWHIMVEVKELEHSPNEPRYVRYKALCSDPDIIADDGMRFAGR